MSKQRIVKDNFWTDTYIEDLDSIEKLLFLYLITNPLCEIAGIYEIKLKRIAYETGIDKEMVDKMLNRLVKDKKLLRVDDWIILVNFAKNQSTNPNVRKGMQRIIDNLPERVKALEGFGRLPHFTLLNLTLPKGAITPNGDNCEEIILEPVTEHKYKNARHFTNEKRVRAGNESIPTNQNLSMMSAFQKINPSIESFNKTETKGISKLLIVWGDDWKTKLNKIMDLQKREYFPAKLISTKPSEILKNFVAIELTEKNNNKSTFN